MLGHKMMQHIPIRSIISPIVIGPIVISLIVISLSVTGVLTACGGAPPARTYTIGVVNYAPAMNQVFEGFKAKMAALGYVEDKNITYIYHGVLAPDHQVIEREVKHLMDHKVDMFLTLGTPTTLAAKQATAGTHIPVVFAPVVTPVKEGILASLSRLSGNVTGVQNGDTIPKALEWLHKIVPHATTVYALYHTKDKVAHTAIQPLPAVAAALGIELVLDEVQSAEEALAAMAVLPKDVAVFLVPSPSLEPIGRLLKLAVQRGIAVGTSNHSHLPAGALVTYAGRFSAMGQQAARLVDQIVKGTKPADLPVETAEYFLHVNLQTATAIGLDIPDGILRQADTVMR